MKKRHLLLGLLSSALFSPAAFAQLQDEKDVTLTMDLQPILQLNMSTADQMDFVFDDISDYYSGITKYAATVLKVSSTVTWDLYAIGNSTNVANGFWDQQVQYGSAAGVNAINNLPLDLLELRQNQPNPANVGGNDYSLPFAPAQAIVPGQNSLYTNTALTPPTNADKYIAGDAGTTAAGTDGVAGGSYLVQGSALTSDYYYTLDYRILPGLPAIFPTTTNDLVTSNGAGSYAQPGIYTMYIQYILLEDQ